MCIHYFHTSQTLCIVLIIKILLHKWDIIGMVDSINLLYKQVSGWNGDHEWLRMTNAFILCDLVWKVHKSHAANREGSFNINMFSLSLIGLGCGFRFSVTYFDFLCHSDKPDIDSDVLCCILHTGTRSLKCSIPNTWQSYSAWFNLHQMFETLHFIIVIKYRSNTSSVLFSL